MLYACLGRVAGLTFKAAVRRRPHVLRAVATDADLEKALQAKSPFLREFASRGYLAQCTDIEGLDEKLTEGRVSAYLGFDATADSLHVGSLLQIMILRLLQKHGHRPVVLVGGGTTKVGDPSGKDLCGDQPVRRVHRQFFTKSFLGDDAAVLARSSGEEPASPRHRAGVASMAWRTTRRISTNAP